MPKPTDELPLGTQLALSTVHASIDRWDKWRDELYQAIADLNAHAARHEAGLPWPPPPTPPGPETPEEMAKASA